MMTLNPILDAPSDLFDHVLSARQGRTSIAPTRPSPEMSGANELCVFLKPEITSLAAEQFSTVCGIVRTAFEENSVEITETVAIAGADLQKRQAVEEHYGVIDQISRAGLKAVTPTSANAIRAFAEDKRAEAVYGAHQFLEHFSEFSAEALAVLYDNLDSERFGGGAHAAPVEYRGAMQIVMNGFHPDQIERYYRPGACILAFRCRSASPWVQLRKEMTGSTNPRSAPANSIRGRLLTLAADLGLAHFYSGMNGIHASAGPLEGAIEIERFFEADRTTLTFASALETISPGLYEQMSSNPVIEVGSNAQSAFDWTEETDAVEALSFLAGNVG